MSYDRIEKQVVIHATRDRVWQAISDSNEFGQWFGVRFEGPFVAGAKVRGRITPTTADPEIAAHQKPYEGLTFHVAVVRIEPQRHLSFRWNPGGAEPGIDDLKEPTTLVSFDLEDAAEGTRLTITESGFDKIPAERRAKAFTENEEGWIMQTILLQKHLAAHATA